MLLYYDLFFVFNGNGSVTMMIVGRRCSDIFHSLYLLIRVVNLVELAVKRNKEKDG